MSATSVKEFPVKRNGFYFVKPEHAQILGREKFVAVTEILSVIGKGGLPYAAARKAAEIYMERPYDFQKAEEVASAVFAEWRKKATLGKTIHSLAEALSLGTAEPLEIHEGYARALRAFFTDVKPEPIEVEVNVYSSQHGYSGTADLIALVGGETTLLDFKTTPQVYKEAYLQLAAYKACDWMIVRGELKPLPVIQRAGVVLLGEDGTPTWKPIEPPPLDVFLAAMRVHAWAEAA